MRQQETSRLELVHALFWVRQGFRWEHLRTVWNDIFWDKEINFLLLLWMASPPISHPNLKSGLVLFGLFSLRHIQLAIRSFHLYFLNIYSFQGLWLKTLRLLIAIGLSPDKSHPFAPCPLKFKSDHVIPWLKFLQWHPITLRYKFLSRADKLLCIWSLFTSVL